MQALFKDGGDRPEVLISRCECAYIFHRTLRLVHLRCENFYERGEIMPQQTALTSAEQNLNDVWNEHLRAEFSSHSADETICR